ncbi:uncharacterized protein HaLaN_25288, partial [Haematococcus lacustris]
GERPGLTAGDWAAASHALEGVMPGGCAYDEEFEVFMQTPGPRHAFMPAEGGPRAYYNIRVPLPLSVNDVRDRLLSRYYRQVAAIRHDMQLIALNALAFHGSGTAIADSAAVLYTSFMALLDGCNGTCRQDSLVQGSNGVAAADAQPLSARPPSLQLPETAYGFPHSRPSTSFLASPESQTSPRLRVRRPRRQYNDEFLVGDELVRAGRGQEQQWSGPGQGRPGLGQHEGQDEDPVRVGRQRQGEGPGLTAGDWAAASHALEGVMPGGCAYDEEFEVFMQTPGPRHAFMPAEGGPRAYYNIRVPLPLSVNDVRDRLLSRYYRQVAAIRHDMQLIALNALAFHGSGTAIADSAAVLYTSFMALLDGRNGACRQDSLVQGSNGVAAADAQQLSARPPSLQLPETAYGFPHSHPSTSFLASHESQTSPRLRVRRPRRQYNDEFLVGDEL